MNQPLQKSRDILFKGLGDPSDYENNKIIELPRNRYEMQVFIKGLAPVLIVVDIEISKGVLELNDITVYKQHDKKGLGKRVLNNLLSFCDSQGLSKITLSAVDVGSYTWARMGFVPSKGGWERLRGDIMVDISYDIGDPEISSSKRKGLENMLKFLQKSTDPKDIRKLANDKQFGKELLLNRAWYGELDLKRDRSHLMKYTSLSATEIKMQQEIFSANSRCR